MSLLRRIAVSASLASVLTLSACAPTLHAPPAQATVQPALQWRTTLQDGVPIESAWWENFGDATLVALLEHARHNNPDIALASARVAEARSTEAISRSLLLPTLEAGISAGAQREVSPFGRGQNSLLAQPLFQAAYEVDLFGRNDANVSAAQAGVAASEAAKEATLLSLSAATASGYVSLLALDARRATLLQTLEVRGEALNYARDRAQAGYTSQLEWRQAQAEYQATAQLLPQIDMQIARQENALSVLTGELPGDIQRGATLAQLQQQPPADVVPSELLRRRPDIAMAEYRLAASDAQMRAARAQFMPSLGIRASAGLAISDLLDDAISVWSLGGSLLAPIFNAGRLQGRFDAAVSQRDQAAFAYRGAVLNAFREVEDRLVVLARLEEQQRALEAQRLALEDALRHARNRYRAGYTPYIEQVVAQRSLLGAELSLIQVKADQINATIGLYQALGGAPN